jgi:hypothetical protein
MIGDPKNEYDDSTVSSDVLDPASDVEESWVKSTNSIGN